MRHHRRQAPERRQPLALRRLPLEALNRVGHRVEGRGEQPRVLVLPAAVGGHRDPSRQVAARRHLAHRRRNRSERAGDGARDTVAEERGGKDGQRPRSRRASCAARAETAGAPCATGGSARSAAPCRVPAAPSPASGRCTRCHRCAIFGVMPGVRSSSPSVGPGAFGQRRRLHLAVRAQTPPRCS